MNALVKANIPLGNKTKEERYFFHMTFASAAVTSALAVVHGALDFPEDQLFKLPTPVATSARPMPPPDTRLATDFFSRKPSTPKTTTSPPQGRVKQKSCFGKHIPVMPSLDACGQQRPVDASDVARIDTTDRFAADRVAATPRRR